MSAVVSGGVRPRRALAAAVLLSLGSGLVLAGPSSTGATEPVARAGAGAPAYSETKTLQRVVTKPDGSLQEFPAYTVTVTADQTTDLRGRQRIRIAWKGAQPSGGRASNPFGESGLAQEYPVVIMQCRGVEEPGKGEEQLRPETCWTASFAQRSQITRSDGEAAWRHDLDADEADKGRVSGLDPLPGADVCPTADIAGYSTRLTPFVAASGKVFPACQADQMPPEAAVGAAFPAAELAAFTDLDGRGEVQFEVRSDVENESLGCNHETACSIVVIPIVGLSCDQPSSPPTASDNACRRTGRFVPGSGNVASEGVDQAVSPSLWWAASQWKNRFTIPITFGLPPDTCDILDARAPTGFYGTELLAQAALQWSPAYCLRKDRFRFQHNVLPDLASFQLMQQDEIPGAFVSSRKTVEGEAPTAYAPTAVTGFAISYVIDEPKNAGERRTLNLNARLLAKLLTQSYPGSSLGRQHPGLEDNPGSLNADPEFQALNPGLSTGEQEAAAVLVSLSESSDVIKAISTYIDDPWGMRINPAYKGMQLPVDEWPLLDTFTPAVQQECLKQNNDTPYLTRLAAPVTSFVKIADALLDAWPYSQTKCSGLGTDQFPYVLGRADRQGVGARFLVGVTTLGDAERYGLHTAALQTSAVSPRAPFTVRGRQFVAPTDATLAKAISTARPTGRTQPFALEDGAVRQANGYPGTLVVYTAAKTSGLDRSTARTVASFIRTATTEGQRRGSGNGFLPDGYLPITRTGTTAALSAAAGDDPAAAGGKQPVDAELKSLGSTQGVHSALGAWFLPALILLLLGCAIAGPVIRLRAAGKEDS